jgi:hypothetical protein
LPASLARDKTARANLAFEVIKMYRLMHHRTNNAPPSGITVIRYIKNGASVETVATEERADIRVRRHGSGPRRALAP